MNNEREGFDKFSVHGEIFDICKSERGEFYRVVDVDKRIAELEAQVEQEAKHYEELQLLIGVCECIAGRGDPPADCSAPQCLNVKKRY